MEEIVLTSETETIVHNAFTTQNRLFLCNSLGIEAEIGVYSISSSNIQWGKQQ